MHANYDAAVVGAGPNGLCAAIRLARAGLSVVVIEAHQTVGGGARTAELTLPGFHHDVCSAIHPMAASSPFLQTLPLSKHGLRWIQPYTSLAHPFDDQPAAELSRSVEETAFGLDGDRIAYERLVNPFVERWPDLVRDTLGPLRLPRSPVLLARFGLRAMRSAHSLALTTFATERAQALIAGLAGHSVLPLERAPSAAIGLMLGIAGHAVGWPLPEGGSARLSEALASYLRALGGDIALGREVRSLLDVPTLGPILFDTAPRGMSAIAGDELPARYRRKIARFVHGPGVFKVDWALAGPIPWRDPAVRRAGTVHLGGYAGAIASSERDVWRGVHPERPFVLLAQPSVFDQTRAPQGKHTGWAYCHVPHGSTLDMTDKIERQVERFAPGFRDLILARHIIDSADLERYNPNYIGGDIGGGALTLGQLFTRPTARIVPYSTPNRRLFLCSASTPPGGGVHGMCGLHAAEAALRSIGHRFD